MRILSWRKNPVRIHKIDARMGLQEVVESSYSAIVESYPALQVNLE